MSSRGPDAAFWDKRRVFLTGHTGFKGGWLALWLQMLGARVTGYALPTSTEPNLFTVANVGEGIAHLTGDIRNADALAAAIVEADPEVILHLAAQPLVRLSYEQPLETYATNVMGTANLLFAASRTPSVQAVVVVTSDKCYENRETIWPYRETDAMGGHDPYSSSKGCTELLTASFFWSFFKECGRGVGSGRAGNVVGGGDWSRDRLIPDLMAAFAEERPAVVRRPDAIRPWQHVLEPLTGYLLIAEELYSTPASVPRAWNFGPDRDGAVTVETLASLVVEAWGGGASLDVTPDPKAVHEATLLTLDATKARRELGWAPQWELRDTVAETVRWYRAYYDGADMWRFTMDQIHEYCALFSARS